MAFGRISIRRSPLRYPVVAAFFTREARTCATLVSAKLHDVERLFEDWDALRTWRRDRVNGHLNYVLSGWAPVLDEDKLLVPRLSSTLGLSEREALVIAELERLRSAREQYEEELRRAWHLRDPHLRAKMRAPFKLPSGVKPTDGPWCAKTGRSWWSPEEHEDRVTDYRDDKKSYKEKFGGTRPREHWHLEVQALRLGMTRDEIWELRQALRDWWPSMTKAALTRYSTPAALRGRAR